MSGTTANPRSVSAEPNPDVRERTSGCLVLVPARGEVDRLRHVVGEIIEAVDADVLVLDGGHNGLSGMDHGGRVRTMRVGRGVGAAVRRGLAYGLSGGYRVVARVDGDGQHDPALLREMLRGNDAGADVVLGSRYHPASPVVALPPTDRVALNIAFRSLLEQLTGLALTDVITGCWVLNRRVVDLLLPRLTVEGYGITLEMVLLLGMLDDVRVEEVPHPVIYAGLGVESKYLDVGLDHRCERAAVYLKVVTDVLNANRVDLWPLIRSGTMRLPRSPQPDSGLVGDDHDHAFPLLPRASV